jgi:uncharacterized protein (DUF2141 family)
VRLDPEVFPDMKLSTGIACFAAVACLAAGTGGTAADLEVEVRNVKPRKGEVRAALFDREQAFAAAVKIRAALEGGEITTGVFTRERDFPEAPVDVAVEPATGRVVVLRFYDLAPGEYALGVYQDLNSDERLDITLGGMSLEPWTVSNDAGKLDEDPRWEDAKFVLPAEGRSMMVRLMDERRKRGER